MYPQWSFTDLLIFRNMANLDKIVHSSGSMRENRTPLINNNVHGKNY